MPDVCLKLGPPGSTGCFFSSDRLCVESLFCSFSTFSTLFSPSTGIQRVGEGHPSAYLTNYKMFIVIFCYLAHTFHAPLVPL